MLHKRLTVCSTPLRQCRDNAKEKNRKSCKTGLEPWSSAAITSDFFTLIILYIHGQTRHFYYDHNDNRSYVSLLLCRCRRKCRAKEKYPEEMLKGGSLRQWKKMEANLCAGSPCNFVDYQMNVSTLVFPLKTINSTERAIETRRFAFYSSSPPQASCNWKGGAHQSGQTLCKSLGSILGYSITG